MNILKKQILHLLEENSINETSSTGTTGERIIYAPYNDIVDDIIKMVDDNYEPKKCMPDGINSKEEHEEYLKAIGYDKYVKDLQHHKDTTVGLYATDKEPEKLFEEIFVHLIEKIGMDGEKTFSAMDYDYYKDYFNKGIKMLIFRIS